MPGGNLNPSGRNQYSLRPKGGMFNVTFDFRHGEALAKGIAGDLRRADEYILGAHHEIAEALQSRQAAAFVTAVTGYGRAQRVPVMKGPVYTAIRSPKNRKVNLKGFTVGYLDDKSKFPKVALYVNGLEKGTSVHKGRIMGGLWVVNGGLAGPVEGAKDAIGFVPAKYLRNGGAVFEIRKAIEGYHFQEAGWAQWKKEKWDGTAAREVYEAWFTSIGHMDFASRLFSRTGKRFTTSQIHAPFNKPKD
jgi:hypothetical protein